MKVILLLINVAVVRWSWFMGKLNTVGLWAIIFELFKLFSISTILIYTPRYTTAQRDYEKHLVQKKE